MIQIASISRQTKNMSFGMRIFIWYKRNLTIIPFQIVQFRISLQSFLGKVTAADDSLGIILA